MTLMTLIFSIACFEIDTPQLGDDTAGSTIAVDDTDATTGDADCSVTLSADAWVVRSVHESISDAAEVWVCAGATADVSGNNGTVYVAPGGTVQVNGNGFAVFGDVDADITFYGNNNEGWVMDPDRVTVLGNGNSVEQCDQAQVRSALGNPC